MTNLATNDFLNCDADIARAAELLKVMSHPIRLKIICQLGHDEKTVQQLIESVGTTQSNVSQHLSVMREKGVVEFRKIATRAFYKVSEESAINLVKLLKNLYVK